MLAELMEAEQLLRRVVPDELHRHAAMLPRDEGIGHLGCVPTSPVREQPFASPGGGLRGLEFSQAEVEGRDVDVVCDLVLAGRTDRDSSESDCRLPRSREQRCRSGGLGEPCPAQVGDAGQVGRRFAGRPGGQRLGQFDLRSGEGVRACEQARVLQSPKTAGGVGARVGGVPPPRPGDLLNREHADSDSKRFEHLLLVWLQTDGC